MQKYASRNWSRTLTERSGGNGAVAVFMACYDCFFVQSMLGHPSSKRYAVGRCLIRAMAATMLRSRAVALKQSYAAPTPMESDVKSY